MVSRRSTRTLSIGDLDGMVAECLAVRRLMSHFGRLSPRDKGGLTHNAQDPLSTDLRVRLQELTDDARRLSRDPAALSLEAILGGLIEPLPLAALVADNEGHYVVVNRGASELTGYSHRELLRLSAWELTPPSMTHDADTLWRAFLQQREQTGVYTLVKKDGRPVKAAYAARAHVLPGLHLSLLRTG